MRAATLAAAALMIGAALYVQRQRQGAGVTSSDTENALNDATQSAAEFVDGITGSMMKISAMSQVDPAVLRNQNVQAILRVIRTGEGTADDKGYSRLYGGAQFASFADHPRQAVTRWGITSTAAGAYQFLSRTWDETRRLMNLPDFSPRSQDLGAVGRIAARGALGDVLAGRFTTAIRKLNREWASLPGSPYGQRTMKFESALAIYQGNGGVQIEQTALA